MIKTFLFTGNTKPLQWWSQRYTETKIATRIWTLQFHQEQTEKTVHWMWYLLNTDTLDVYMREKSNPFFNTSYYGHLRLERISRIH